MTVASDVKNCIASLNGAKSNLSRFALMSADGKAQKAFHECMLEADEIIQDLRKRLVILEREEPQYKN
ncbi:NADH dehydrogenase [Heyndrickxia sporothermodurans]|nr:NADH dehydrogenase [Heyndrickxia sporothermodurans]